MTGFFDGFFSLRPRVDPGGRMKEIYILPPAIFLNVFNACNFSMILNLFDSNKL